MYMRSRGFFLLVNSDGSPDVNVALAKAGRKLPTATPPHSPYLVPSPSHLFMGSGCDGSLGLWSGWRWGAVGMFPWLL